jgi:hypothetical protein
MSKNYKNCNNSSCSSILTCSDCDFSIKQGDNCPSFKIQIKDPSTGNPISFEDWEVEAYMYFYSNFKSIKQSDDIYSGYTYYILNLLGNQNLYQIKIGDIIEVEDCNQNLQEFMIVENVDKNDIYVIRGYGGSDIYEHKRGDKLIFYRIYNKEGFITSEHIEEDYKENFISEGQNNEKIEEDFSIIGYSWDIEDTSHKGIYFLQLKVRSEDKIRTFPVNGDGYKIIIS